MTFIITSGQTQRVLQLSDRRLTIPRTGRIVDDMATKAVCLACADALVVFGYTGCAHLGSGDLRTDLWIAHYLTEAHAGSLLLTVVCEQLSSRLAVAVAETAGSLQQRGVTIVVAGLLRDGRPVGGYVTNQADEDGSPGPVATTFTTSLRVSPSFTCADGSGEASQEATNRLAALQASGLLGTVNETDAIAAMLDVMRTAAADPATEESVGRDYMSVVVTLSAGFSAGYHPHAGDSIAYTPHLVQPNAAFLGAQFSSGRPSPSEGVPFEEWCELDAQIDVVGGSVEIRNCSADAWEEVRVDLDGEPPDLQSIARGLFYSEGYVYRRPSLAAGGEIRFGVEAGVQPKTQTNLAPGTRIATALLTARLPSGEFGKRRWRRT